MALITTSDKGAMVYAGSPMNALLRGGSAVWPKPFTILGLFAGGEQGAWYDPSDLSTLWQDTAATTPVTTAGQSVARMDDKSGNGNHAIQATVAARPTYQTDGTLHWLEFDGVDDFMVTPTITPGTDKVQVFAGVRKLSASTAIITELSSSSTSNNGTFAIISNTRYEFRSRGAVTSDVVSPSGQSLPANSVITGIGDISADISTIRLDGSSNTSPVDQGLGDYLAYPLYIGARSGPLVPFKGDLFGLTVRFGPALDVSIIESTEADLAAKTGVTL